MAFYGGLMAFYGGLMGFYGGLIGSNGDVNGIWLVVEPTPLKNMTSSVGMIDYSQYSMESHSKFHGSKAPTRLYIYYIPSGNLT